MNKEEEKIEEFLKDSIGSVRPSRNSFDTTIKSVTESSVNRNTNYKGHYKLISFFMNKMLLVGVPVAIVAVLVFMTVNKPGVKSDIAMIDSNNSVVGSSNDTVTDTQSVASTQSADEFLKSVYAVADAEAQVASNESEEEVYINSQVDAFNNLSQTQYENDI